MPGFEFTPAGILPLGQSQNLQVGREDVAPPVVKPPSTMPQIAGAATPPATVVTGPAMLPAKGDKPLTARELLTLARARIKEIDRQLRNVPALQTERASLQGLISAAQAAAKAERRIRKAN